MNQNHLVKKEKRMTIENITRIQNARVKRGRTGWSKFVLRVLKARDGNHARKWSLPHIVPLTRQERLIKNATAAAKNREDLVCRLIKAGISPEIIASVAGPVDEVSAT